MSDDAAEQLTNKICDAVVDLWMDLTGYSRESVDDPSWLSTVERRELEQNNTFYLAGYRVAQADSAKRIAELEAEVARLEDETVRFGRIVFEIGGFYQEQAKVLVHQRDTAEAEVARLADQLRRHGFVPCDMPECNCNGWHARYGLYERMRELEEILAEAGHPLSNENGNLIKNALKQLVDEVARLTRERDAHAKLLQRCGMRLNSLS